MTSTLVMALLHSRFAGINATRKDIDLSHGVDQDDGKN
jgi:hypothetical protein